MTEKVRLPKEVCDALDKAMKETIYPSEIIYKAIEHSWINDLDILNEVNTETIMRALVLGYEPELTAEEQIKKYFEAFSERIDYDEGYREGVRDALRIHGIHYDWLGDAE